MIDGIKRWLESEPKGNKIGLFRAFMAIFGGLLLAYLGMTLGVFLIPGSAGESIIIPLLFNTLAWAVASLWIVLAPTRLGVLWRALGSTLFVSIALLILFFGGLG